MPDSVAPDASAMGRRRLGALHFWSLLALSSVWVYGAPYGVPGEPESGDPETIACPRCGDYAKRQMNELYLCRRHHSHMFRRQSDGSYKSVDGPTDDPDS